MPVPSSTRCGLITGLHAYAQSQCPPNLHEVCAILGTPHCPGSRRPPSSFTCTMSIPIAWSTRSGLITGLHADAECQSWPYLPHADACHVMPHWPGSGRPPSSSTCTMSIPVAWSTRSGLNTGLHAHIQIQYQAHLHDMDACCMMPHWPGSVWPPSKFTCTMSMPVAWSTRSGLITGLHADAECQSWPYLQHMDACHVMPHWTGSGRPPSSSTCTMSMPVAWSTRSGLITGLHTHAQCQLCICWHCAPV